MRSYGLTSESGKQNKKGKQMGVKYCHACKRNVTPSKKFNWLVFIFLCGLFYLPVYLLKSKKCPICGGSNFGPVQ